VIAAPVEETPEPVVEQPVEEIVEQPVKVVEVPKVVEPTICGRHLKSIDDLKSFPQFKEGERGSSLYKFLTKEIWDSLHDKKDALGVSFK
jgi:hypothetical protein